MNRIACYINTNKNQPSFIATTWENAKTAAESRYGPGIEYKSINDRMTHGRNPNWDPDIFIILKIHKETK